MTYPDYCCLKFIFHHPEDLSRERYINHLDPAPRAYIKQVGWHPCEPTPSPMDEHKATVTWLLNLYSRHMRNHHISLRMYDQERDRR